MEYQEALTRWARKFAVEQGCDPPGFIRWDDDRLVTLEIEHSDGYRYSTYTYEDSSTVVHLRVPFIGHHVTYLTPTPRVDPDLEYDRSWGYTWDPSLGDTFDFSQILGAILEEANGTGS